MAYWYFKAFSQRQNLKRGGCLGFWILINFPNFFSVADLVSLLMVLLQKSSFLTQLAFTVPLKLQVHS